MLKQNAFTLLELIIVIAIIGLLASLVLIPNLARFQKQALASRVKNDFSEIAKALELAAGEGCTSISVQAGSPLECQGVTYLRLIPGPPSTLFSFYCGVNEPLTTSFVTGCTFSPSQMKIRAAGFTAGEFKCLGGGTCFCTDSSPDGCKSAQ